MTQMEKLIMHVESTRDEKSREKINGGDVDCGLPNLVRVYFNYDSFPIIIIFQ